MNREAVDRLIARLERAPRWPPPFEAGVRQDIRAWAAFRDSETDELRRLAQWPNDRAYVVDNLPEKIPAAYATLLFGEEPAITAPDQADQPRLDDLTKDLNPALKSAVELQVSEGEVWWRISADQLAGRPTPTFHSRCDVIPLLSGREPVAVAFISMLDRPDGRDAADAQHPNRAVWRHLEIHADGSVDNVLYRGTWGQLGNQIPLADHPETAELPEIWQHDLPILAGRIVYRWGKRPHVGRSAYTGIWTRFLLLNEATTIGKENMRLTAKKRAVVPMSAVRAAAGTAAVSGSIPAANGPDPIGPARPTFDAGEDVLVYDPLDADEGSNAQPPFKILEYSFDAAALILYLEYEVRTICQRADIVPQFIGAGDFGHGDSGTALRVRLMPTVNASQGVAGPWDTDLPEKILARTQMVSALPRAQGGFGVPWAKPTDPPSVKRTNPLPDDPTETAMRLSTLKTSELISIEQGVKERNPTWDPEQVTAEVDAIRADTAATVPRMTFPGPAGGA